MKKSILALFSLLAVALLFTGASGCLEKKAASNITTSPAAIDSVIILEKDGNLTALIKVIIHGTHAQSLDQENITVKLNKSNVNVFVPVVTKEGPNTMDLGYETVEVVLGKSSAFEEGKEYRVIVNGNNGYGFLIENNVLTIVKPAPIDNIVIKSDGKNVVASVTITISGTNAQSVDTANIITSEGFKDNKYDISIPVKTVGNVVTLDFKWVTEDFVLSELSQLQDGTYTVNVNGQTTTFTIKNNALIDSSQ